MERERGMGEKLREGVLVGFKKWREGFKDCILKREERENVWGGWIEMRDVIDDF